MSDDDFDKIEDEDFAEEFDFVGDEDHLEAEPGKTSGNGQGPKQSGRKFIPLIAVFAVVLIGGYFTFQAFGKKSPEKVAATPKQQLPADQLAQQQPADQHIPGAPITEQHPALPPVPGGEPAIDFNQHPGQMPNTGATTIEGALPQDKSFSQIQKDLRNPNAMAPNGTNIPKSAIPVEINATLDAISEEMTLNVNQIKHLENIITNLASTVEQLNKSISAMDNRVLGLTETVDGLAQDLNNVKKVMADEDMDLTSSNKITKANRPGKTPPISAKSAEYSVHAIIPGRAWLKSSDGQIITVTEGDKVGDYGTVAVIDAANGLVRTSSGITFR